MCSELIVFLDVWIATRAPFPSGCMQEAPDPRPTKSKGSDLVAATLWNLEDAAPPYAFKIDAGFEH